MDIRFDSDKHEYWLGEVLLPNVTEILRGAGILNDYYHAEHDYGRDLGKAVHKACELEWKETLDQTTLSTPVIPYLQAFKKFLRESKFKILAMEQIVYNSIYKYAGTTDIVAKNSKDLDFILDIKTGKKAKWHTIQTAGYSLAMTKEHARACLYLADNETYKLEQHANLKDKDVFLSALTVFNWKNEK